MKGPHDRLIADAAKEGLTPLGFRRFGRSSRRWIVDLDWWVLHDTFQASAFGKGSYRNVGASWLWHDVSAIGYGGRIGQSSDTRRMISSSRR